jgi:hypothetical protein
MIEPDAYSNTELVPFFRVHHSRYMLYWPYSTPEALELGRTADTLPER